MQGMGAAAKAHEVSQFPPQGQALCLAALPPAPSLACTLTKEKSCSKSLRTRKGGTLLARSVSSRASNTCRWCVWEEVSSAAWRRAMQYGQGGKYMITWQEDAEGLLALRMLPQCGLSVLSPREPAPAV